MLSDIYYLVDEPLASPSENSLLSRAGRHETPAFSSLKAAVVALLICVYLLPIWIFKYVPTQDGPSHIYNSQVLREFRNSDYRFREHYDLNLSLFPNWLSHISLAMLMAVFSPTAAEKILLTIYVIMFPLAIFYFLDSVNKGRSLIGLMSFLFIYNYLLLMGFYNFAFSVPLFFLALGFWWKNKERLTAKRIVLLNLLLVVIYFTHLITYVTLLLSIAFLSVFSFRKRLKKILLTLGGLLPSSLLLLNYLLSSRLMRGGAPGLGFSRAWQLLKELFSLRILVSYSENQSAIACLVSALMLYMFIHTLWMANPARRGSSPEKAAGRGSFLFLIFALFILYLILPRDLGPGGWVNERMSLLVLLGILAWFRESDSLAWKRAFIILVGGISLANMACLINDCKILNKELHEYTLGIKRIENNKIILPLYFDGYGKSRKVGIFINASNYYCLDNGGINLGNYEVQSAYFPIHFKDGFQPPADGKEWVQTVFGRPMDIDISGYSDKVDYLLLWGKPDPITAEAVRKSYYLIASRGRLKILKPNK